MSQRSNDLLAVSTASRTALASSALFLWRQAMRAGRRQMFVALGSAIAASLCGVALMVTIAHLLALGYQQPVSTEQLMPLLLVALIALMLRALFSYISDTRSHRNAAQARVALRHILYNQLLEHGPILGRLQSVGDITTILLERVDACDGYIARFLPQLAVAVTVPPVVLVLVGMQDLLAAGVLLLCGLLLPVFLALSGLAAGKASRNQFTALSRLATLFHDRVKHLATLRVFGAAERETNKLEVAAQSFRHGTMRVLRVAFLSASALDIFFMLALATIAVHVFGQPMGLTHQLTVLLLVVEFFAPLRALSASYHDRASALAAVADIQATLEPRRHPVEGSRPAPSPLRQPSLELRNITYTYPGRTKPALDNYTVRVEGSEFLAISGPSGAGKSTLINLLLGFIEPDKGMMFIATQPLHLINHAERTAAFSLVGQRNYLFHGTLADNIRLGRPEASEVEIMKAAELAQLGPFIRSRPEGLNTLIGDRGFGLSGGQAQRVAIARAFLRDAPVLLLDEPTAGLDHATAALLMLTIRKLVDGRTTLMVSHDPIALKAAERVVKLELHDA